jgi:hypothetical protein
LLGNPELHDLKVKQTTRGFGFLENQIVAEQAAGPEKSWG